MKSQLALFLSLLSLSACGSGAPGEETSSGLATGGTGGAVMPSGGAPPDAGGSAGAEVLVGAGGAAEGGGGGAAAVVARNACCETSDAPGCADAAVEACICELRPECCSGAWDAACVALVDEKHCEPDVRSCVCEDWQQSACCDGAWDTFCKITAEEKCGAAPACVAPLDKPPPSGGACCEASTAPGCADSAVEQCVCEQLPDCCTNAWDAVCVELVRQQTCAPDVRTCVCEDWQQAGCCGTDWTDFCTITAQEKCGAKNACL